uniref:MotA/TolQ/ExbB proton channel family protein n=2 Tax=Baaleninema simplex TaxID=2862350 RepID=UPI00037B88D3|nr:MotA/TolQ/ExbB proton channel family protein [Baaleninema simplex]
MLVFELLQSGGLVMIPLLIFSIVAIALIAERVVFWSRVNRRQSRVIREALNRYSDDPYTAAHRLRQNADLPMARIFLEAVELQNPSPEAVRLALESSTQQELPLLRRFNTAFDIIIGASPLLGLLGTILGLIRSFASLQLGDIGSGSAMMVTGGISEALISTAAGLIVAIFTLIFANIFRGFYKRQLAAIQACGSYLELLCLNRLESDSEGRSNVAVSTSQ